MTMIAFTRFIVISNKAGLCGAAKKSIFKAVRSFHYDCWYLPDYHFHDYIIMGFLVIEELPCFHMVLYTIMLYGVKIGAAGYFLANYIVCGITHG
jgi:hypothetical protein